MKVLLVDDEKFAVEGLKNMLHWDAFDGVLAGTASCGTEALNQARLLHPDVIVSDIKMPDMDGLELSKAISEEFPHISVILLSGHGEFEYARQAIKYGVKDYILKPITREKIYQLEQLLCGLSEESASRKEQLLFVWDQGFKSETLAKLRKADKQYFDDFFQSDRFFRLMEQDTDNSAGLQLLNFLFQFFSEIRVSQEAISHSKKQAMSEYLELTAVTDKRDFIITKYYDILLSLDPKNSSNTDTLVNMALKYADANFARSDFNISALASELNISISHLSTIFKQSTGGNLSSYITSLRINRSKELLADGRHPISDIASLSGYEDPKYFAKLFKKKTGYAPSEYRNFIVSSQNLPPKG